MERMTQVKMVEVSNNSPLTNGLSTVINKKFTKEELAKFHRWLQLVGTERVSFARKEIKIRRGW